jgi:endonuclease/exonuclease/phosphatase (EEP) superfamily protein YafD
LLERGVPWRGDSEHKGLAVSAVGKGWSGQEVPLLPDTPISVLPVVVSGPVTLTVVGVWTQKVPTYTEHLLNGLAAIKPVLPAGPLVVMGDFNNHPRWDNPATPHRNHAAIVQALGDDFGLVSAYHHFHGVEHGSDSHPTLFFQFDQNRPYHIDYIFVPREWVRHITRVVVGSYDDWKDSDHRPLSVTLDLP